ncbi:hypothetical protein OH76DRAFT_553094 [Lentinus brumalis]|uniref:Uncharacterized protein n=1 Tax=Lentinus brumalis TaxID=2498619 RepID=A0A371D976_9APHY|nr:hypothetical protein OH76DRAFT_553094 [Polyporus brumalis]
MSLPPGSVCRPLRAPRPGPAVRRTTCGSLLPFGDVCGRARVDERQSALPASSLDDRIHYQCEVITMLLLPLLSAISSRGCPELIKAASCWSLLEAHASRTTILGVGMLELVLMVRRTLH